jgi:prepilin-type processing-associated H-X9-DG protein
MTDIERPGGVNLRRGHTVRDTAVGLVCLVVAGSLLLSLTGANRNLSRAQVCTNNLRQLYAGMTAYVNQYNSYPPHAPYPTYTSSRVVSGLSTYGWDPNIGFILTHGLGLQPPATDTQGHFIWYVLNEDEVPDICVCPARAPWLLVSNPEIGDTAYGEPAPLETYVYQYALSYQTSGTCRAACPVLMPQKGGTPGTGGRNPPIPDPTNLPTQHPYDNATRGIPSMYVCGKDTRKPIDDPSPDNEFSCWIQAVNPSEVDHPSRAYYMADTRDYRPAPKAYSNSYPPAGTNMGWLSSYGNRLLLGSRHYGWANVMYLDGRISRDEQQHDMQWNMDYKSVNDPGSSPIWRCATFATDIKLANIRTQAQIMPVLMAKGWEYFFTADGMRPR